MMNANDRLKNIAVKLEHLPRSGQSTIMLAIERFFYQHKRKLVYVHIAMFLFFLICIVAPLLLPAPAENETAFSNFTLFVQFLIWGIWFPLVFVSVIFTGRSWCGILCPMGAASEWTTRFGMHFKIPSWLKWEGTPIFSFLFITILGQTIDVRDEASAIAELFGGTLLFALIIGFLYGKSKKRAWCRHVCPIGLLLGVFSRLSIIQFTNKLLYPGKSDAYTENGICPTMIDITHKQESRHCIQCFRCVKPTSPGGLYLKLRSPGDEIRHIRTHSPKLSEVLFIFLSTGVALGGFLWLILPSYQAIRQFIGAWFINHGFYFIGNSGPQWLMSVHPAERQAYNWLDFITIVGFMLTCMLLSTLLLSLCTFLSAFIANIYQPNMRMSKRFIELGYQFSPVAVISIIIGLGDVLFGVLSLNIPAYFLSAIKIILLASSIVWSIYLGRALLIQQNIRGHAVWFALIPGIIGSMLIAFCWWPAIFGIHFSILESYRQHLIAL